MGFRTKFGLADVQVINGSILLVTIIFAREKAGEKAAFELDECYRIRPKKKKKQVIP